MKKKLVIFSRHVLVGSCYFLIVLYAFIFNNTSGWFMFYFFTAVLSLSLLAVVAPFKKLQLTNETNPFFHEGSKVNLELALLKGWSIPGLGVRVERFPNGNSKAGLELQDPFFFTGKKQLRQFEWLPKKRGIYHDLSLTMMRSDFFQLFSGVTTLKLETAIYVLPKKNERCLEELRAVIHEIKDSKGSQSLFDIKKYRLYQDGDSWRLIDWKQSARNRDLIVKQFETEKEFPLHLIFLGGDSQNFEEMLSCYYTFQKNLSSQINFDQTIIGEDGCCSVSDELFAKLTPYQEIPRSLTGIESIKEKTVFIFLTFEKLPLPDPIKKLERHNHIYYIGLAGDELYLEKANMK